MAEETSSTAPSFQVRAQYIKDLSFENPHAPQSLIANEVRPNIDVGVDLRATKLQDEIYEVVIQLTARAGANNSSLFLVELAYAGIFYLSNIAEERLESVLLVDCPFVLFPFARRVIADVTRDGGFPPLMLDPIDFHQLYLKNQGDGNKDGA
jgi:preprotein translocase subunit SecB